jgi:carboxyl-terminal processing protease
LRLKGARPVTPKAAAVVRVSRFFQRFVFVLSVVICAALGLGFALGEFGLFGVHAGSQQDGAYRQMRVYAEVLGKIQTDYVTEPNLNDVTTGALHGLLESLDADSSYLTPTEYKIYRERPAAGQCAARLGGRPAAPLRRRHHRIDRRPIHA